MTSEKRREYMRAWRAANANRIREWRAANHEHIRERERIYNANHPDQISETRRRYYAANRQKKLEAEAKWRAANLERNRDHSRRWNAANRERHRENSKRWQASAQGKAYRVVNKNKIREAFRKWAKANPEKVIAYSWIRSRRLRKATPAWVDRITLGAIKAACPPGYHVDHIIPLRGISSEGYFVSGLHVPWNLQYLPSAENQRKHRRMRPEDLAIDVLGACATECS